ncbi:MAG: tetratricopeptide repeat protein, partial [Planctomycetes bacterium]|nr:tetratricopeptide repeat protein [Planctomycetota bacterium]
GLEIFLNLLMLLFLLGAVRRNSWWRFLVAGVLWGLSALVRPNVLALAPGIVLGLWVAMSGREQGRAGGLRFAEKLRAAVLVFGGAALTILPVTIRNYLVGGEPVLIASNGGLNFYIGNNALSDGVAAIVPHTRATWEGGYEDTHRIVELELGRKPTEGEVSRYWYGKSWEWIRSEPGAWAALMLRKFRLFWSPVELSNNQPIHFFAGMSSISALFWVGFPVVVCLGVPGLLAIGRGWPAWRAWSLPLMFAVIYSATVIAFFVPGRFRLPVVPVFILLTAQGLTRLPQYWRARKWRVLGTYLTLACLCALFLWSNPPSSIASYHRGGTGQGHHHLGVHYEQLSVAQPQARDVAAAHFLEAMRLRPNDTTMALLVASSLLRLGYPGEAEQLIIGAVARHPDNVAVRQRYAEFLAITGRWPEAVEQCQKLIALDPLEPGPQVRLGALLMHMQRETQARVHLDKAIELGADPLEVWHELGSMLVEQGRLAAALEEFDKILQQEPNHVEALLASASALDRSGRHDEAANFYREVLRQDARHKDAARALASLLRRMGQHQAAIDVLGEMLKQMPDDLEVLNALAWMLATAPAQEVRNGAKAVRFAERAMRAVERPTIPLLNTLAAAYAEAGRFEDAVAASQRALSAARQARQDASAREIQSRLDRYQRGQPHRDQGPDPSG